MPCRTRLVVSENPEGNFVHASIVKFPVSDVASLSGAETNVVEPFSVSALLRLPAPKLPVPVAIEA